jgi:hypothetical protein
MQRDLNHWNKYDGFAARPNTLRSGCNALGSGGVAGPKSLESSGPNVRSKALGSGFAAGPKTHGYMALLLDSMLLGLALKPNPRLLGLASYPT